MRVRACARRRAPTCLHTLSVIARFCECNVCGVKIRVLYEDLVLNLRIFSRVVLGGIQRVVCTITQLMVKPSHFGLTSIIGSFSIDQVSKDQIEILVYMGILATNHYVRLTFTDKDYLSGDLLKGQVQLYVASSCLEASLLFTIRGREVCRLESLQTAEQESKGKHRIFTHRVELQRWKQKLKRGLYAFPFEFQLPERLPASFDLYNQFYSASIKYTVKATFQSKGKRVSDSLRFRVTNDSLVLPSNAVVLDTLFPINRCCISSASVTIAAYLEKTWFSSLEDVTLDVSVTRSNVSVEVREVTVDLVRRTRLKNNSQGMSAVYNEVVHGYHMPVQFPPGQTRFPAFRIGFSLPRISRRMDLTYTIHSLFLENVFIVQIQVTLGWAFCLRTESPILEVPIDIVDNSKIMTYVPPFPTNRHPDVMQTSVVEIEKTDMTPSAPPLEFS